METFTGCPVIDRAPADHQGLGEFRRQTGQKLIHKPSQTDEIMSSAAEHIEGYYGGVLRANPAFGRYKVARELRSIVFSAALFNGATFNMNWAAPELELHNEQVGDNEPFDLAKYARPLPELETFSFDTPVCEQFVKQVGSILLDWGEVGILDPSSGCEPLSQAVQSTHERLIDASAKLEGVPQMTADMEAFVRSLSEDNAHALLHTLIGLGGYTVYSAGATVEPSDMAAIAIAEQRKLAGLASVSRPYAQAKIRPIDAQDGRAADVIAYEQAVLRGETMPRSSTAPYFTTIAGEIHSPHPSLAHDQWREPRMCAGFPRFVAATHEETQGNIRFMRGVENLVGSQDGWPQPRSSYSATDAGVNIAIITALETVYPAFPLVA